MIVLAIFHDIDSTHCFSWTLKKGFKHVLVCAKSEDGWTEIDYLGGRPSVRVMAPRDFNMNGFYEEHGFTVVPTVQKRLDTPIRSLFRFPFMVNNCVGLAQSILGITGFYTPPYSLYRCIKKDTHRTKKDTHKK